MFLRRSACRCASVSLRLVERRLVVAVVDLEEELAGFHRTAVVVDLLQEVPLHARPDLRIDETERRPDPFGEYRHVLLNDFGHQNRRCWRSRDGFMAGTSEEQDGRCDRDANDPIFQRD